MLTKNTILALLLDRRSLVRLRDDGVCRLCEHFNAKQSSNNLRYWIASCPWH
ncbi:hypothetical protein [Nitrosomonas eutropha]|uniref:hypothetical protein n=1 Tax=Nitrosomonas eutropha TaxID=916 RepID=UPI0015A642C2|nr:hypothetical protein [Nitrosomonas eutropha]